MNTIQATVTMTSEKPDKNGKIRYSVKTANDDNWYGFGLTNPKFEVGDKVQFDAEQRDKWWNGSNPRVLSKGETKTVVGSTPVKTHIDPKERYWANREANDLEKDKRIQFMSSRNAAISVVDVLLREKALKLPTKQASQYDTVLAAIDEITNRFERQAVKTNTDLTDASVVEVGSGETDSESEGNGKEEVWS